MTVGPSEEEWTIHEGLVTETSAFFAAAVKKVWAEGQSKRVKLPEEDANIFHLYARWLYEGKLLVRPSPGKQEQGRAETHREEQALLVECYILGDKLQDSSSRNTVINSLLACTLKGDGSGSLWWPVQCVDRVYEVTCSGSPLRRLFVEMYTYHAHSDPSWVDTINNGEFGKELARELILHRARPQVESPVEIEGRETVGRYNDRVNQQ